MAGIVMANKITQAVLQPATGSLNELFERTNSPEMSQRHSHAHIQSKTRTNRGAGLRVGGCVCSSSEDTNQTPSRIYRACLLLFEIKSRSSLKLEKLTVRRTSASTPDALHGKCCQCCSCVVVSNISCICSWKEWLWLFCQSNIWTLYCWLSDHPDIYRISSNLNKRSSRRFRKLVKFAYYPYSDPQCATNLRNSLSERPVWRNLLGSFFKKNKSQQWQTVNFRNMIVWNWPQTLFMVRSDMSKKLMASLFRDDTWEWLSGERT